ncbi:MAG: DUF4956 domain-containing protein [Caldisericia bacterium]|nr:DUF4956 domain-containing protein [Caldisericia bacterium]MDD4615287.1 DUF4956 domain-containing protein [Caldisericia bacterium]
MNITFADIFKTSFIENASTFSFLDVLISFLAAFLIGTFIYLVYKKTFQGVLYSRSFNISLLLLTIITTFVLLAVTSNIILSLGMVGALSIVRFRTAIKDPMDLVFLFWSIGTGIVCGAGLIPLAFIGSILIGIVLLFFVHRKTIDSPYILSLQCIDENTEEQSLHVLKNFFPRFKIKSKSVSKDQWTEILIEIHIKDDDTTFIKALRSVDGIQNINLVSFSGDYVL